MKRLITLLMILTLHVAAFSSFAGVIDMCEDHVELSPTDSSGHEESSNFPCEDCEDCGSHCSTGCHGPVLHALIGDQSIKSLYTQNICVRLADENFISMFTPSSLYRPPIS